MISIHVPRFTFYCLEMKTNMSCRLIPDLEATIDIVVVEMGMEPLVQQHLLIEEEAETHQMASNLQAGKARHQALAAVVTEDIEEMEVEEAAMEEAAETTIGHATQHPPQATKSSSLL